MCGNDFEGALLRPEIDEEIKFKEILEKVKDVRVTKEIQEIWLEQNKLLQQG